MERQATDELIEGWMDRQADERTDKEMDRGIFGQMEKWRKDEVLNGQTDKWMSRQRDEQIE
jgi:hypothetical protein